MINKMKKQEMLTRLEKLMEETKDIDKYFKRIIEELNNKI